MRYIKKFEPKNNTVVRKLINFLKEVSKSTRGLLIEKSKTYDNVYHFRYGEMLLIKIYILNSFIDGDNIVVSFFDDELKYMPQLQMIKEYILSNITYSRIKGHVYESKYLIIEDDKTNNVNLSKDNYELFISTNKYNL